MPNYRRFYNLHYPVFITVVTENRTPWLIDHSKVLLNAMRESRKKYSFNNIAHVILPDHFHWMFEMKETPIFSKLISFVKRDVTWRLKESGIKVKWQKRFYDHVIRDIDDFDRHLDYLHYNPLKHNVASNVYEYPYSSFNEWVKRGRYDTKWGQKEPRKIAGLELE